MKNMRQIKRVNAIYMRILEGKGVEKDPYREEEYVYFDDEDKLFLIDRSSGEFKEVREEK